MVDANGGPTADLLDRYAVIKSMKPGGGEDAHHHAKHKKMHLHTPWRSPHTVHHTMPTTTHHTHHNPSHPPTLTTPAHHSRHAYEYSPHLPHHTTLITGIRRYNMDWASFETSIPSSATSPMGCPAGTTQVPATEAERIALGYVSTARNSPHSCAARPAGASLLHGPSCQHPRLNFEHLHRRALNHGTSRRSLVHKSDNPLPQHVPSGFSDYFNRAHNTSIPSLSIKASPQSSTPSSCD
jgi:hypothetical protein